MLSGPTTTTGSDAGLPTAVPRSTFADAVAGWAAPLGVAFLVGLLAIDQGGYFPTAYGWGSLITLWALAGWLISGRRAGLQRLDIAWGGAFALLAAWTAISLSWSDSLSASLNETNRAILYAAAVAALLLLAQRWQLQRIAGALWAAITLVSLYGLCTRLFPNRLGSIDTLASYRLADPIGYWNGLAIFAVAGILIAFGLAARSRVPLLRTGGAVSLVFLAPVLYFTFSRGAWIALGVGLVCAFAYDRNRLQLVSTAIFVAPAPVLAVAAGAQLHGLTHAGVPFRQAVHDGHRLALVLVFLAPIAVGLLLVQILLERSVNVPASVRRGAGGLLLAIPAAALALTFAHYGSPATLASDAYRSFKAAPTRQSNLNKRLLSLTNNGRIGLWHVAWVDFTQHRALGSGPGTYARYWARDRAVNFDVQDAHSLYLETLAELGPIGLVLLVLALVVPFAAAIRARHEPLAAVLFGAYVALVLHAAIDWDFELPAVALTGLLCGTALLIASRRGPNRPVPRPVWAVGLASVAVLTAFAVWSLVASSALAASNSARERGDFVKAAAEARKARRLMPWSPEPWDALGRAQYAAGATREARSSFHRAVARDPGNWSLWFDLAVASKGVQRQRALAHASRLNPRSFQVAALRRG